MHHVYRHGSKSWHSCIAWQHCSRYLESEIFNLICGKDCLQAEFHTHGGTLVILLNDNLKRQPKETTERDNRKRQPKETTAPPRPSVQTLKSSTIWACFASQSKDQAANPPPYKLFKSLQRVSPSIKKLRALIPYASATLPVRSTVRSTRSTSVCSAVRNTRPFACESAVASHQLTDASLQEFGAGLQLIEGASAAGSVSYDTTKVLRTAYRGVPEAPRARIAATIAWIWRKEHCILYNNNRRDEGD